MIAIAQIEAVEQYRRGESSEPSHIKPARSKEFFVAGMRRMFGFTREPKGSLNAFYSETRCGLFHNGITKSRVGLSGDFPAAVAFNGTHIQINPWRFVQRVTEGVAAYVAELSDTANSGLRKNFLAMFEI